MASRSAKKGSGHLKIEKGKEHMYNAKGAPEEGEAMDEEAGMHKGGKAKKRAKRRHGGHAHGKEAKHRADKKERGHHAKGGHVHMHHAEHMEIHHHHSKGGHAKRASGGRTPYTSGHMTDMPSEGGKTNAGHESQRP